MPSWEVAFGLGALLLVLALAYGVLRARRRTPEERRAQEQRTKEIYDRPAED